ncbi:MAG: patatin-like phospholipase family protein, partial [Candidatus Binatia bacterium]
VAGVKPLEKETRERVNLVLAGAGTRLPAYAGALAACKEMGVAAVSVAGTAAGGIMAAYVAAGWTVEQMYHLVMATQFGQFRDFSIGALLLRNGLYSGKQFEKWMRGLLKDVRFAELRHDLYIAATDLISQEPVIFSRYTTPEMSVAQAVRFSMSFPGMWSARRWNGKVLVDGNLTSWIPHAIRLMESNRPAEKSDRTVVLRLVTDESGKPLAKKHLWPWDFAKVLAGTMGAALENQRVPGELWKDTVLIHTGNVNTFQFTLSQAEKEELFRLGYEQVRRYLHKPAAPFLAQARG